MIKLIESERAFVSVPLGCSHHACKIKSLYEAYGLHAGICRFYCFEGEHIKLITAAAALMDSVLILAVMGDPDTEELAAFIRMTAPAAVDMPAQTGRALGALLAEQYAATFHHVMRFSGAAPTQRLAICDAPRLEEAFAIIQSGFNGLRFEDWYVDTSHRVRHGVSRVYTYQNAATCTMQYDLCGRVFLSQIATLPLHRGKGLASALVSQVAGDYAALGKEVTLNCRDALVGFYRRVGFEEVGAVCELRRL